MNTKAKALVITASYAPKLEKRRETRVHAALNEHGVRITELDWMVWPGSVGTEIEVYVDSKEEHGRGDPNERASRIASALRACGLVVNVRELEESE
jgi:hypothetical protein